MGDIYKYISFVSRVPSTRLAYKTVYSFSPIQNIRLVSQLFTGCGVNNPKSICRVCCDLQLAANVCSIANKFGVPDKLETLEPPSRHLGNYWERDPAVYATRSCPPRKGAQRCAEEILPAALTADCAGSKLNSAVQGSPRPLRSNARQVHSTA